MSRTPSVSKMSSPTEQSLTLPPEARPLTFIDLPDDVMRMVVDHLTDSGLNHLARTCKASYTVCNWELYKRDSQTLDPQARLWGVFTGQIRSMEFAINQYNADINQVFIWPPRSSLFKDRVKEFALANAVNVTTTHMSRVSFRGSDDTGFNIFAYEQGPCPRPEKRAPWTALHFAAVFNQVEATKFLLQNGADPTVVCPRDGFLSSKMTTIRSRALRSSQRSRQKVKMLPKFCCDIVPRLCGLLPELVNMQRRQPWS